MPHKIVVIGAGLGGLAAAALLANRGYRVTLFEKNGTPGGKMQERVMNGYRFDTGPSLFTMPFILDRLYRECGKKMEEFLTITEPDPLCRYFYRDGVVFDSYTDRQKTLNEIKKFAPDDTGSYLQFLDRAEVIYNKTADAFLFNPLYGFSDLKNLKLSDFLGIDAFSTVSDTVDAFVKSPHLRQFFKRFTTYNGSSPYKAPATLNVIPHVELNQGGYYVQGGLYRIAEALERLAMDMGANIRYNQTVTRIEVSGGEVTGLETNDGTFHPAGLIFANADATDTILNLLPEESVSNRKRNRQKKIEPSCSGFVLMLGCNRVWPDLRHHNIFFSRHYKSEFQQIFEEKQLPDDPTIYIANTSYSNPEHAPAGSSNLFILVNAPYLHESQNWYELTTKYSRFLIEELERRGLGGLKDSIEVSEIITPFDFYRKYGSNRGSIYGTSSNSRLAAFLRPRNKLRGVENLYMVGGSTHPGGGIPLVIQSAFNAVQILDREESPRRE